MTKEQLKNEIKNSKNQSDVFDVVDKFDDSCNLDMDSDLYTGSDMVDNIYNLDCYGESRKVQKAHGIGKDVIEQDKRFLDRFYNNDFPDGFDLLFYEEGKPAALSDVKDKALDLLDEAL